MDKLVALLPQILLGNGVLDVLSAVDPTGFADNLLATQGAFKNFDSAHKAIVVSAFSTSMITHGVIRIFASQDVNRLRNLAIISYLIEIFQALRLYRQGALSLPEGGIFVFAPIGAIILLLQYKAKKQDKQQ